jgi:Ca-activated chloride channel family protein
VTWRLGFALSMITAVWTAAVHSAQEPAFRTSTLGVRVDVLVTDGRKPVAGLGAADFEVRDNGVLQSIQLVDVVDVPLNVVLALDTSASTTGTRLADLISASQALIDGLTSADRVALATFSHAVMPRIALTADLGSVRQELLRLTADGRTAVMDAAYVALTTTLAQGGRSLVVVCTDGSDISSWLRTEDVIESAKRSNAVIYAVASAKARQSSSLQELSDATGGSVLRVSSAADLRGSFQSILQEFRSRYILSYTPEGVAPGGFHRLEVRVKRRGVTVKSRPGYVGLERPR